MNHPNPLDFAEKKRRIRAYLAQEGFDAMLLMRRDNFAWATFGGDNTILRNSEQGFGVLVFTMDRVYLVARYMDADRIMDDELNGLDVEKVCFKWFEDDLLPRALQVAGNGRIVSDVPCTGCSMRLEEIRALQLPFTPWEVARWREVGALFDRKFLQAAKKIERGMTEQQAAAILSGCFEEEAVAPVVLLVGGDGRIARYRHPLPSEHRIERVAMIHLVGMKQGLCAAVSRMLSFGPAPEQLERDYDLLNQLQAAAFARLVPGGHHGVILEERKRILREQGRAGEYENHFPGGDVGYYLGSSAPFLEDRPIQDTACYDIYLTLTGSKVEELVMATEGGGKILSQGYWPTKRYRIGSYSCDLPVILEK